MKFIVTMKTPDALEYAIKEAIKKEEDNLAEEIDEICSKWFSYGEEVQLEIDTALKTCTVKEK